MQTVYLASAGDGLQKVYGSLRHIIEKSPSDFFADGDVRFEDICSDGDDADDFSSAKRIVYYFKHQSKLYGDDDKRYYNCTVWITPFVVDGEWLNFSIEDIDYIKGLQS